MKAAGESTWHEDHLVPIHRHGQIEDAYWTYSCSPVNDDNAPDGGGGVLVLCNETTPQCLAAQRLRAEPPARVPLACAR